MQTWALDSNGQWVLCEAYRYSGSAWESLQFNEYARLDEVWDSEAAVIAGTPPTITLNPLSQSVLTGSGVTFTASANGTSPITWTWHKDGGSAIAGAGGTGASTSYTLPSVSPADAGSYVAKATNAYTGSPVSSTAATLTVSAAALAYIGADGLVLGGAPRAYASTDHAAGIQPLTGLDVIVIATSTDWSAYWGNNGGNVQALIGKAYGGALNLRCWDLVVNSAGQLIGDLSTNGTSWASIVTSGLALTNSATYAFRLTWNKTGGATALYAAELTGVNDTYPASWAVGLETGDTPVATATRLNGSNLYATTANLQIGCTDLDGVSAPFKGTVHYAEVRTAVAGSPVWSCDFRNVTELDTSFPDDTGALTITVQVPPATGDVEVGMPNGTETVNVGPTAAVLGHSAVTYASLASESQAMVITEAEASAVGTTVTYSGTHLDGTFAVYEGLNVFGIVDVTASTTPVLIRNSKIGAVRVSANSKVRVEWCDTGRGYARSGDTVLSAGVCNDATETANGTSGSLMWKTSIGAGADTVTVQQGALMDSAFNCSGDLYMYRCNMFGHADGGFQTATAGCTVTLEECWIHDMFWAPRDASRLLQNPNNSHNELIKVNGGDLTQLIRCRIDMWPVLDADMEDMAGPYWRGPHWGKNPNGTNWPCVRPTLNPGQKFVGTGSLIANQSGGTTKNVLMDRCIVSGPIARFIYLGNNASGTTYIQNVTIKGNRFLNGVTEAGFTAWTNPRDGFGSFTGGTVPSSYKWHWPITGPNVNYKDDLPMAAVPKAGMLDLDTFVAT